MLRFLRKPIPTQWVIPVRWCCIPTGRWKAATTRAPTAAQPACDLFIYAKAICNIVTRHHYAAVHVKVRAHDVLRFARMMLRILLTALVVLLIAAPAHAHPHVWVTMHSELVYAPDGSITGIRHAWSFDDMFSTFAIQELE